MRFFLFLLLIFAFSFSTDCAGYSENLNIRVLDTLVRPVEGASVQVTFDRGATFGEKYFTTQPKKTDENGTVLFTLLNQGTKTREIDCNIYITAWFGETSAKKTIVALQHPLINDVKLPVYQVTFYVRNQNGKAVENAKIFFVNETKKTDKNGKATFYAINSTAQYLATYKSGSEGGFVSVAGDVTREVIIPLYEVNIGIFDDHGEPLNATIDYANETIATQNGYALFNVYRDSIEVIINYENLQKKLIINAKERPKENVYFDLHAPIISEPKQNLSNNRVRMAFEIKDIGQYASGVNPFYIKINYRILPESAWQKASVYSLGGNSYGIDFPEVKQGTIVEFSIQASDYDGNTAYKSGRFVIEIAEQPKNDSVNKQENKESAEQFPIFYVVFGAIFIIFVIYLLKKIIQTQKTA